MTRFLLAAVMVLTACGGGGGPRSITYYFTADPRSLDPAFSTDVPSGEVIATLFDNLTQFDADGRLVPGIATRWEADTSGAVYTFHLRTGAAFHDGRPISAATVAASFRRVLSLATKGSRTWTLTPIRGAAAFAAGEAGDIEGIAVPDDSTIVITLEEPLNVFPKLLAMPASAIVPESVGPDFSERPVGSGPWRLVEWSHDDVLLLAANEGYWGGRPASDTLRIRIIPEPLTQAAEFEFGQLAVVEVPFSETAAVGSGTRRRAAAPSGASGAVRGHQHPARAAPGRARAARAEHVGGRRDDDADHHGGPRRPRGRRHSARPRGIRQHPGAVSLRPRRPRARCSRRRGTPTA